MADLKKPVDPQVEIEQQIGELEERVDRLRAMYEQYFMGYEKLEPSVPRKDVDRRFTVLRKVNIRNTAVRFRFNVVTQKYNTYAMYWTRICRQIEEGTFKRHIVKANKRFGGKTRRAEELSIDVDLGDFEDFDAEAETADALAEAEAATRSEPPQISMPKSSPRLEMPADTDRPPKSRSPSFGEIDPSLGADSMPPPSAGSRGGDQRVARHAVLPAGARQRVLVKKGPASGRGDAAPNSTPRPPMPSAPDQTPPPMRARMPSVPETDLPPMRARMPSVPELDLPPIRRPDHAPSTSVIRAAPPQGGHVHRPPPGVVRPQISPTAGSVNRVPVAKPAPSVQRVPAAEPNPPPSVQRVPAAEPNPPPSVQRVPAASPHVAPSVHRVPVAAPRGPNPAPSVQRVPAAAPTNPALGRPPSTSPAKDSPPASVPRIPAPRVPIGLPSSVGRVPAAADANAKAPAPPPPSERKLPIPPPSQRTPVARPGGPMPAAPPVRPPAPSAPDSERNPVPSRRPPPPLPSQLKKP